MYYIRCWLFYIISFLVVAASIPLTPILFLNKKIAYWYSYYFTASLVILIEKVLGITCKITGLENVPKGENFIVASKHLSAWETFYLSYYFKIPVFVLKQSLFMVPVFGWFLWRVGMIGLDRTSGVQMIKKLQRTSRLAIADKRHIVIFPQGTRVPLVNLYDTAKYPYKRGIVTISDAVGHHVPILPVSTNSVEYFGRGFLSAKKSGKICLHFLKPIQRSHYNNSADFMKSIQNCIEDETRNIFTKL